ncbi:PREDICTED: uncharacterized protein LOC108781905 [Cyphomyrmex costatus]|uniref:uncharacterized protein LOC108781905 n=1 Tax=Cyphomyrmex costatus TaxID=456900 RepID=UPI000852277F|nr:PREDICTED: uncharacterized protein LOC108781905 [Cyphomyrmex costatus]
MEVIKENGFTCKHCNVCIVSLDAASVHECLRGKDIYMDSNNALFINDILDVNDELYSNCQKTVPETIAGSTDSEHSAKQSAIWTDEATMALLSLYEANKHMLDHPKKKSKIWIAISDGLKNFEIQMSSDQVRWKMNILQKKYKDCCDKSSRDRIEFKWYSQLDEIFGKNKDAVAAHTVSSKIIGTKVDKPALSDQRHIISCGTSKSLSPDMVISDLTSPIASAATISIASPLNNKNTEAKIRPRHGTGSNLANKKMNIEQQWLKFL